MQRDEETEARFVGFLARLGKTLRTTPQRTTFAAYAGGILGDSPRKSCEPMAALRATDMKDARREHDKMLYFLSESVWDDRAVRLCAAREAIAALEQRGGVSVWVIDDTGFPKQGRHSVGVQRQYSGTLGKVGNCQIGVSLSVATRHEQVPIDFELYLPEWWALDPARRALAHVPDDVGFATKIELAIDMIERARLAELPGQILLADAFYGCSAPFRDYLRAIGKDFAVAIRGDTTMWLLDSHGRRDGESACKPTELGRALGRKAFRRVTWRLGTKGKMASRFCFRRVKVAAKPTGPETEQPPLWLVMEWPDGEDAPTDYFLTTLPARMTKREIVRIIKERWHTEQVYSELKGELGLDHFEGRSYPAWHHHITVVLSCYAFLVAERSRRFPPSGEASDGHTNPGQSRAALRGFPRLASKNSRACPAAVATPLPSVWARPRTATGCLRSAVTREKNQAVVIALTGGQHAGPPVAQLVHHHT